MNTIEIIEAVSDETGVSVESIIGKGRKREVADARHIAAWIMRSRLPGVSLKRIGIALGGRHHATVISSIKEAEKLYSIDAPFRGVMRRCLDRVGSIPPEVGDGSSLSVAPTWSDLQITVNVLPPPTRTETGAGRTIPTCG